MGASSTGDRIASWLTVIFAVPLLYVLTLPPIVAGVTKWWRFHGHGLLVPHSLTTYSTPYGWLTHTPLRGPCDRYFDWWWDFVGTDKAP